MLHQLHAIELALVNLIDDIWQFLEYQPTLHLRVSLLEAEQIVTSTAADVNDEYFVFFRIAQSLLHRISAIIRPHGL
jgi:hypothetical protein